MADQTTGYNDRALTEGTDDALPKPQIEIIVDGNSIFKPGMKTFFVDSYDEEDKQYVTKVMGEYCTCDTVTTTYTICTCEHVCTCNAVCTCEAHTECSCDSVCSCENVCSCDGYQSCSCESHSDGGGQWVSCGSPCACVPVH